MAENRHPSDFQMPPGIRDLKRNNPVQPQVNLPPLTDQAVEATRPRTASEIAELNSGPVTHDHKTEVATARKAPQLRKFTTRIEDEAFEYLTSKADQEGRSVSQFIRRLIEDWVAIDAASRKDEGKPAG